MGLFDPNPIAPSQITAGASDSFLNNVTQGIEQQYRVDSPYSLETELADRWATSLDEFERLTGERLQVSREVYDMGTFARDLQGQEPTRWNQEITPSGFVTGKELQKRIEDFRRANGRLQEVGLASLNDIFAEVSNMQQSIDEETIRMGEAGGFLGGLGMFTGQVIGSFNSRDPLTLGTLGIGGFGKTIWQKLATEGLIQAGITGVQEVGSINPNRELAGLQPHNPLYDMAAAFVLGAGIRGGLELIPAGLGKLSSEATPEFDLNFEDPQLRQMLGEMPDSPRKRAAESIIVDAEQLQRISPYGDGPTGLMRFVAEAEDVARIIGGEPETAVARALPDMPIEYIERAQDFQIVREQAPEVYEKMKEAQAVVEGLDARMTEIEAAMDATTVVDAARLVDPEVADRLAVLERVVNDPSLPDPQRQAADLQARELLTRVGEERIAQALQDAEIAPRKELQRLRRQRQAANKRLRETVRAVEHRRDLIRRLEDVQQGRMQTEATNVLRYATAERPLVTPLLTRDAVARQLEALDLVEPMLPERALELAVPAPDEMGMFDIGLPERVSGDFAMPVEAADGTIELKSVREIFREFEEEIALDEAVRTCSL